MSSPHGSEIAIELARRCKRRALSLCGLVDYGKRVARLRLVNRRGYFHEQDALVPCERGTAWGGDDR